MNKIKCGVIGVGYLGRFHAQKYHRLEYATLVGVYDINFEQAQAVALELNVTAYSDLDMLLKDVEAVSIAVTTRAHYDIAKICLLRGIHVLLEKPMTETLAQAKELIEIAKKTGIKFQIGHLERFNAARLALEPHLKTPLFIESNRIAPYNPRGADVNVVLDLMIHDIDLIQTMVQSPVAYIDASGAPVLSNSIDIASARITFENHCVANVTASRVSFKSERKMRLFQHDSYISIDYQENEFAVFEKGTGEMFPGIPNVIRHQSKFEKSDALFEEIKAFLDCIENNTTPLVTAEAGYEALATAAKITDCIHHNLMKHHVSA